LSSSSATNRGSISVGTLTRAKVADEYRERQREARDVRERAPRADGQRCEHGEDLTAEALGKRLALRLADVRDLDDPDAVLGQGRDQLLMHAARAAPLLREHAVADPVDRLRGRQPVRAGLDEAGVDLVMDAGDADLEELVQVRAPDRGQLDALQQRLSRILDELQDAVVEVQPRQLAAEVQRLVVQVEVVRLRWPAAVDLLAGRVFCLGGRHRWGCTPIRVCPRVASVIVR